MKTLSLILAISIVIGIALFIIFFWETILLVTGTFFIGFLIYALINSLYIFILEKLNNKTNK